jgi:hypothetical protein
LAKKVLVLGKDSLKSSGFLEAEFSWLRLVMGTWRTGRCNKEQADAIKNLFSLFLILV